MLLSILLKHFYHNAVLTNNNRATSFFKTLEKKQGACLRDAPWTNTQINLCKVNLLSRKKFAENLLECIIPMFDVNEYLNRFAGLQPLYEGTNLLDPHYCRKD